MRERVRRFLEFTLTGEFKEIQPQERKLVDEMSPEDRALFQELTQGVLREWKFLEWVLSQYAKRAPKGKLKTALHIAIYQFLFLDRIPAHAIYSETKKLCQNFGAVEAEIKFAHGVLKSIEADKEKLIKLYAERIVNLATGELSAKPQDQVLDWAVLNAAPSLADALTVAATHGEKKTARSRAISALAAMKQRPDLVGYVLASDAQLDFAQTIPSTIAPWMKKFEATPQLWNALASGAVRIQGEASQWACHVAAEQILKLAATKNSTAHVLEMTAGNGGKLLGTLSGIEQICAKSKQAFPKLQWVCVDSSTTQLDLLEKDALPIVKKRWPNVNVEYLRFGWERDPEADPLTREKFDFIWLDAPCTGFGTLAKLPQISITRGELAYEEAKKASLLQFVLSEAAFKLLADPSANGSRFFYTVCTLTRPETLDIVDKFVTLFQREPLLVQAIWPGQPPAPKAEGFFVALF